MKHWFLSLCALFTLAGCGPVRQYQVQPDPQTSLRSEPGWYQDAVFYHIWVKSFYDSGKDGIGDLQGVIQKLDYLNSGKPDDPKDLGINAIWLSPVFSCQRKDEYMHGYDTTDFYTVNPLFGTNDDLKALIREAHKRGIRVIFDYDVSLVSQSHPWFLDALKGGSKRDWFVWDKNPDHSWHLPWSDSSGWRKVWHGAGDSYYYGLFGANMPNLNYRNPDVLNAVEDILTYWLNQGFDGARVDAARYLVEDGPNLGADRPGTHKIFQTLRHDVLDAYGPTYSKMMVAEAWTRPDTIRDYFGSGSNEFSMAFDFSLPQLIVNAVKEPEESTVQDLKDYLTKIQSLFPAGAVNGTFLSNHDEVMDRPFTAVGEDPAKAALAFAVNALAPGTPFVYYGNEIGMPSGFQSGDGRMRTDFDWDEAEKEVGRTGSLWSTYKSLISERIHHSALRRGRIDFLDSPSGTLAFFRQDQAEKLLVLINLTDKKETISQDLGTGKKEPITLSPRSWKILTVALPQT